MELTASIKETMLQHVKGEFPNEACGLVLSIDNVVEYFPCRNDSDSSEYFRMNCEDYAKAEDTGEILAVFHSHPNMNAKASGADVTSCNYSELPWIICSYPAINFNTIYPSSDPQPLIGREFTHGVNDCYSLIYDYYKQELGVELVDPFTVIRKNDWWTDETQNLYIENYKRGGFINMGQDANIHINDVLLMCVNSKVPNHGVVYLGGEKIIHHLDDRLSRYDVYGGFWQKNLYTVLRHERFM